MESHAAWSCYDVITARKRSCRKVMFLHLSVSHSVHRGVSAQCMLGYTPPRAETPGQTPPGQTPPWADTPPEPPSQKHTPPPTATAVSILLECFFVHIECFTIFRLGQQYFNRPWQCKLYHRNVVKPSQK